jgi:hypothetical protein
VEIALGCVECAFLSNLGSVQRNGVLPAGFHVAWFSLRLSKLIASMGESPLGHGDDLVETQSAQLGAQLPPFKGEILRKEREQSVA